MSRRRPLRRRVLFGALVTIVLTIAGIIGMRLALGNAERRNALVTHTLDVIVDAERLARRAGEAQAAMRGYLLLRDPQLASTFTTNVEGFEAEAATLAALVADSPRQLERLTAIGGTFAAWRATVSPIASNPTLDDTGRQRVTEAAQHMIELRRLVDDFVGFERQLLASRRDARTTAERWLGLGMLAVVVFAVGLACFTAYSLALRVARDAETLADAASAVADGDLDRRVSVRGNDELAVASDAFNTMADRLRRRRDDEVTLGKMRDMLQSSHAPSEAHAIVARLAPQCLEVPAARLYVINSSRNLLAPAAAWGDADQLPGSADDGFAPTDCWALRNGRPHVVKDPALDVACPHLADHAAPSVCLPLIAQGETVGLLAMAAQQVPHLAREVGEIVGLTLGNLRLREVLRNQAIRDPLTGLFNRRYLEETLVREVARVRRKQGSLAVIVLDVDHFKRFNDTYGHHGGDVMLREVGSILGKAFRDSDVICRFGGEEFVVVAPDCTVEAAVARTEEMRARVRAINVTIDGRQVSGVTMSAGIAMFPDQGETPEALFQAADRAVYRSKSEGRDRVTVAGSEASPVAASST